MYKLVRRVVEDMHVRDILVGVVYWGCWVCFVSFLLVELMLYHELWLLA